MSAWITQAIGKENRKRKDTVQRQIFVPANFCKLRNQHKDGRNLRKLVVRTWKIVIYEN